MEPAPDPQAPAQRPTRALHRRSAAVLLAGAVLVVAGCGGGGGKDGGTSAVSTEASTVDESAGTATPVTVAKTVRRVRRELRGIPQNGLVLGSRTAPVTILEYGHFACQSCAAAHGTVVPAVIERYVRDGKASLEFRGIGGDSATPSRDLALGAYAASTQRHGWDYVQLAYLRGLVGATSAGGTPTESAARLAAALGLDVQAWRKGIAQPAGLADVKAAASVAAVARFSTFPVFLLRARSHPEQPFVILTNPQSVAAFADAIARAGKVGG